MNFSGFYVLKGGNRRYNSLGFLQLRQPVDNVPIIYDQLNTKPSTDISCGSADYAQAALSIVLRTHCDIASIKSGDATGLKELFPPLPEGDSPPDGGLSLSMDSIDISNLNDVHVGACRRQMLLPTLRTRLAEMEDHDDLVEVFDGQTMLQSSVYGDYFIAELIGGENSWRNS